jgi:hypothetical protein
VSAGFKGEGLGFGEVGGYSSSDLLEKEGSRVCSTLNVPSTDR